MSTESLIAMLLSIDQEIPSKTKNLLSQLAELYNGDFEFIPAVAYGAIEFVFCEHDCKFTLVIYDNVDKIEFYFGFVRDQYGMKYNIKNMKFRSSTGSLKNNSEIETIKAFVKNIGVYVRHGIILYE